MPAAFGLKAIQVSSEKYVALLIFALTFNFAFDICFYIPTFIFAFDIYI